jgi:predicted nucleic acid-binding protein
MELYYFDASALVKYYVLEPGSTWVRGIINPPEVPNKSPTNIIFIAEISVPEVAAAFAVVHRRAVSDDRYGIVSSTSSWMT